MSFVADEKFIEGESGKELIVNKDISEATKIAGKFLSKNQDNNILQFSSDFLRSD